MADTPDLKSGAGLDPREGSSPSSGTIISRKPNPYACVASRPVVGSGFGSGLLLVNSAPARPSPCAMSKNTAPSVKANEVKDEKENAQPSRRGFSRANMFSVEPQEVMRLISQFVISSCLAAETVGATFATAQISNRIESSRIESRTAQQAIAPKRTHLSPLTFCFLPNHG